MHEVTGGLTGTVGIATSKFMAKVASELDKPDGLTVVATRHRARPAAADEGQRHPRCRPGHRRAAAPSGHPHDRRARGRSARTSWSGCSARRTATGSAQLARAQDGRPVVAERETKSVSVEDTYDTDLTDRRLMEGLLTRQARGSATAAQARLSGRTVTIKVRLHDFTTLSRSSTLSSPTDDGGDDRPGGPRRCSATWTPPVASGCSGSASRAWPTGSRRTSSGTTRRPRRTRSACPNRHRARVGARRRTSSTTRWGRLGLGIGLGRGDGALRDRRDAGPARCAPSGPTTRRCTAAIRRRDERSRSSTVAPGRSCAHGEVVGDRRRR